MTESEALDASPTLQPIPGPDPGACPECGGWRKAGMLHDCEAHREQMERNRQAMVDLRWELHG